MIYTDLKKMERGFSRIEIDMGIIIKSPQSTREHTEKILRMAQQFTQNNMIFTDLIKEWNADFHGLKEIWGYL